jgi:sulfur-oxidizing protein SoxZ
MSEPQPRINVTRSAVRDEIFLVRALITHPMETGLRKDESGQAIPRRIINRFTCELNGKPVCEMVLHPAISANPYISFFVKVEESGTFVFAWHDDDGSVHKAESKIDVTA